MMLLRIGLVAGGLLLAVIYYGGFYFVFIFVLGIHNGAFLEIGYWLCFTAAAATVAYLFRNAWSPAEHVGSALPIDNSMDEQNTTSKRRQESLHQQIPVRGSDKWFRD